MRTLRSHNNGPIIPDNDGPRCLLCEVNPRRLRQTLCPLGGVFLLGLVAYATSYYFDNQTNSINGQETNSLQGKETNSLYPQENKLDPNLLNKMALLENQINNLQSLTSLERRSQIGENPLGMLKSAGALGTPEDRIKGLIKNELRIYDSDKTGITDYALENLGACIKSIKNTESLVDESSAITVFGFPLWSSYSSPRAILQPSMQPGQCWAFKGKGEVVIELMSKLIVTSVSLEHVSRDLSPYRDISSAPKDLQIFGISYENNEDNYLLGTFKYDAEGPPLQMFDVQFPTSQSFEMVEVHFNSNQGNKDYTCVYRVRVHGKLPDQKDIRESREF